MAELADLWDLLGDSRDFVKETPHVPAATARTVPWAETLR